MRFTHDDLREALNHKDWLDTLTTALTHEERSTEQGPTSAVVGVPNAVVTVRTEDPRSARLRTAVALGLVTVDALIFDSDELKPVDLAALRLREGMTGEHAPENEARLRKALAPLPQEARADTEQAPDPQTPQNAENAGDKTEAAGESQPGPPVQ
jgi:hypothetical protein